MCLLVASLKEPLATAKFLELANAGENPLLRRRDYTGGRARKGVGKGRTVLRWLSEQDGSTAVEPPRCCPLRGACQHAQKPWCHRGANLSGKEEPQTGTGRLESSCAASEKEERHKGRSRRDSPCCVVGVWTANYEVGHREAGVHIHTRLRRLAEVHRGVPMFWRSAGLPRDRFVMVPGRARCVAGTCIGQERDQVYDIATPPRMNIQTWHGLASGCPAIAMIVPCSFHGLGMERDQGQGEGMARAWQRQGKSTEGAWQQQGSCYVFAMIVPCSCSVLAMVLPRSCHDRAMFLPCSCHDLVLVRA